MFDFQLLVDANQQRESQNQNNHQIALEIYQEALQVLDQFQKQPRHLRLLSEAAELLLDSIYYHHNQVEPYLKLAGIFYILGKDRLVTKYLLAAKKIQPHHPEIRSLESLVTQHTFAHAA